MNDIQCFWSVHHPEHGKAEVTGVDKLQAITAAARVWKVPWTSIARECTLKKKSGKTA